MELEGKAVQKGKTLRPRSANTDVPLSPCIQDIVIRRLG